MSNPLLIRDQVRNPQIYVESTLTALVESSFFSTFIGAMILTNSIFIGIQTEYEATTWQATVPPFFVVSTLVAIPKKLLRTQNLSRSSGTRVISIIFFQNFSSTVEPLQQKLPFSKIDECHPKRDHFNTSLSGQLFVFFWVVPILKIGFCTFDDHVILVTRKTGRGYICSL